MPMPHRQPAARQPGFTLVEVLAAVLVLGVLAAVAYPTFLDAIRKSRRAEAFSALSAVQQTQERWRSNHTSYITDLSSTGLNLPTTTFSGYYGIAVDAADSSGYTATATAVGGTSQANDGNCVRLRVRAAGGSLFYGSAGASGTFDESAGNRCWSR